MKIVKPFVFTAVAPAAKTSSNVASVDTGTVAYSATTTYALDDLVTFNSDVAIVTITLAAPGVITWAGHELIPGDLVSFTTTGALPPNITANFTYFVKNILSTSTFTITAIEDGLELNTLALGGSQSGTHTITVYSFATYRSLQAANLGKIPRKASSATWWQKTGTANRHKMFDGSVTSQTIADYIDVTLTVNYAVDTIALLNISGYFCLVTCTDATLGVVYNVLHTIYESINGILEDIPELIITNIANFSSGTIRLHMYRSASYPVAQVGIGACLVGKAIDAGGTEYGASMGVQDFSVIEENDFGDMDIVPRANRKLGSFQVMVPKADVAKVHRILSKQKTKRTLYVGTDAEEYAIASIYGFPDDWTILISYPEYSVLNIDIKGLT